MRLPTTALLLIILTTAICGGQPQLQPSAASGHTSYIGFDSNDYPGDNALPALRRHFTFAGYWLTDPPGARENTWKGKRDILVRNGFGFLVLADGRLEAEIGKAKRSGTAPSAFGEKDAAGAVVAAAREHFPPHTIIFLDQEEGGRLTDDQSAYLLAWTEAVARSSYLPGVYASGQEVPDEVDKTITTVQDIREQVAVQHLHHIAFWVYQDACPPANGCTLQPPPLAASGTPDAVVWQYAQSPRRKAITMACSKTYAKDGNCYVPDVPGLMLDLSTAGSPDPSNGR
jgi:Domain of unknown function (DUF1906)